MVAQNTSSIYGGDPSKYPFSINSLQPSWEACQAACQANFTAGGPCTVWTWHDPAVAGYARQCWFRLDGQYSPTPDALHTAGYLVNPPRPAGNVWAASLAGLGIGAVPGLRLGDKRLVRARYPNADPETDGMMPPRVFRGRWTPQSAPRVPTTQVDMPATQLLRNTTVSMFQTWTAGMGGTCERFQPSAGYWCSIHVQGGGSVIYYVPTAMQAGRSTLPNSPYANAQGAIVQTWRPGHWV